MSLIETRTFKSGNSVAVRLPRELGYAAGTMVTIEQIGQALEIRPVRDAAEDKRRVAEMIAARRAVGPVGEIEQREEYDFPDRADD